MYLRDEAYPRLPVLDGQLESINMPKIISTIANNNVTGLYAAPAFSTDHTISQQHYNRTRYQITANASDLDVSSDGLRLLMADLRLASLTPFSAYPTNLSLDKFVADYKNASRNGLQNFHIVGSYSYFNPKEYATFNNFDPSEALDLSREFCNKRVRSAMNPAANASSEHQYIFPPILNDVGDRKSALVHSMSKAGSNRSITFAMGLEPWFAVEQRHYRDFFEGSSNDDRVKDCDRVYKFLLDYVSVLLVKDAFLLVTDEHSAKVWVTRTEELGSIMEIEYVAHRFICLRSSRD